MKFAPCGWFNGALSLPSRSMGTLIAAFFTIGKVRILNPLLPPCQASSPAPLIPLACLADFCHCQHPNILGLSKAHDCWRSDPRYCPRPDFSAAIVGIPDAFATPRFWSR
jgi:hypothetical protein